MEPLIILLTITVVTHLIGRIAAPSWRPWPVALRTGVAAMFTATGIAHFVGLRDELIDMVPPALPAPEFLVTATGVLELAGAAALLWTPSVRWAACGLGAMLIAMFPANVYKALHTVDLSWDDRLLPRTLCQIAFLAAVAGVFVNDARRRRSPAHPLTRAP